MPRKPKIARKSVFTIAMSKDTGAIAMIRTNGSQVTVVGSLTREDSLRFVQDIADWSDATIRAESRLSFPH